MCRTFFMPFSYLAIVTPNENFNKAFEKHVPAAAVSYCYQLWAESPFNFNITKERSTKLGDFKYRRDRKVQSISINHNLNPYQFLITYIHEVAHYRAFTDFGLNIKPHGREWKQTFQKLLIPMLKPEVFPKDILLALRIHMRNPKASTGADLFLSKVVKLYNKPGNSELHLLADLKLGETFELRGRQFLKQEVRRTRVVCTELATNKKYLISAHAEVNKT